MSKSNEMLLEAFKKGYKVTKEGNVIGLKGDSLSSKSISNVGYHFFSFRLNGIRKTVQTHRLQAYQKYGDNMFEDGVLVRHNNGNALDNSWDNILIGTQSDNMMDKSKEQRRRDASNPKHNHEAILKDREEGMNYEQIMKKHNISSKGTVSFIINKSLQKER